MTSGEIIKSSLGRMVGAEVLVFGENDPAVAMPQDGELAPGHDDGPASNIPDHLSISVGSGCAADGGGGGAASQPPRPDMNTGDGTLPAPSPCGTTQRRRSAAGLSAGHDSAPAMRRNGAAGPAESGENPQGTINADMEVRR